jgi:hypothetical protein
MKDFEKALEAAAKGNEVAIHQILDLILGKSLMKSLTKDLKWWREPPTSIANGILNLVDNLMGGGLEKEEENKLQKLSQAYPDNIALKVLLAANYCEREKYKDAVTICDRFSDNPWALVIRGLMSQCGCGGGEE